MVVVPSCIPFDIKFTATPETLSGALIEPEIENVEVRTGLVVIIGFAVAIAVEY